MTAETGPGLKQSGAFNMPRVKPAQQTPELSFRLVSGDQWTLAGEPIDKLLMIVVYRGLHCPVCKSYVRQLDRLLDEYAAFGVSIVAVSADSQARARQSKSEWDIAFLRVGYGLTEQQMRDWDVFVSHAIKEKETHLFAEPAIFLIKPDRSIYYSALNSMPFGRPDLKQVLGSIKWLLENDYPARGAG
jgi:peroxiredoxin